MDETAANQLAQYVADHRQTISDRVAGRLLRAFPELMQTLRLEENYQPVERMAEVAVRPLSDLVRAMLLFAAPDLAETELRWARGVLPRWGVSFEHTTAMISWYFEELSRLPLTPSERAVAAELEQYLLNLMRRLYRSPDQAVLA